MIQTLNNISNLSSGIYAKPDTSPDTKYLQAVHFNEYGQLDDRIKSQLNSDGKAGKHLLHDEDILFAAKGTNNFGVVYRSEYGKSVASSSFIVIRIKPEFRSILLPEYLTWFLSTCPEMTTFHSRQHGTTVSSISIKMLADININIPSVEKQQLIIKIQELRNRQRSLTLELETARSTQIQQLLIRASNQ